jgi:cytochrome c oxidase assembly protein subunit 15
MAHASIDYDRRVLVRWLLILNGMILLMVSIGGVTRLTDSGLSMVNWNLFMGTIPPTSETDWATTFADYQAHPEYQTLRPTMDLEEFKQIFFWEYLHRMWGRLIGLVWLCPYLYFLARKTMRNLTGPLALTGLLILLQGLLGWYMVKSGLVDKPYVSHYRLAAHLGLAFFVFSYNTWWIARLMPQEERRMFDSTERPFVWMLWGLLGVICLQILYGAFVAGMDAGHVSNTFPKMMDTWIPPGMFEIQPGWKNFFENATVIHFTHRVLGTVALLLSLVLWFAAQRRRLSNRQKLGLNGIFLSITLQWLLGVGTVVTRVSLPMALLHQANACILVGCFVFTLQSMRPSHHARQKDPKPVTSRRS